MKSMRIRQLPPLGGRKDPMAARGRFIMGLAILLALSVGLAPTALAGLHHARGPASHAAPNGMPSSQAPCACPAVQDLAGTPPGPVGPAPLVSFAKTASQVLRLPLLVRLTVPPPELFR